MALAVVTSFFNIYITVALKISFSFLFIAIISMKYGPVIAGICSGIVDLLQFIVRPVGPYQPLLTLTAVLLGIIYGLFLYKNHDSIWRIVLSHLVVIALVSTLLNSYFVAILYGKVFTEFLVARLIKNAILFPVEVTLLIAIINIYNRVEKKIK